MAHTLSSQQAHFQSEGYSSLYNRTPNPLSAHQSSLHTCNGSMPCLSGLESPLAISSCSSSYLSVGSPSAWQLSNPAFLSCSKNVDIPTGLVDLEPQIPHETANHVQSSSSDFATNKLDNVGWQIFLEPTMSLISPNTSLLPVSVSTGSPVEGAILAQLLGRLENNNCSDCVSPPGTTLAGGSAQHLGSAMRNGGCLWNQVDASTDMGLAVDSAKGDFLHHGLGLANSQCMIQFSLDPGFTEHAVSFPSFANVDQTCHPFSSNVTGGLNLSLEASQSLEKSNANKFLMTSNYTTQQNSPNIHCNLASTKFHFGQNAEKVTIPHDVKNGETATQDDSDRMSYIPASFHLVVAMDEAKLLQNGASPANSSSSIHKELIETQRKKRQKSISEEKVKDDSCLSETSKKKMDEAKFKRQKSLEQSQVKEEPKLKVEKSSSENSDKSVKENPKPPEPPKQDYIHVRARRGQATDSHSLAERVRREKISERMKFLQDLVPGCNKVTGKALMLDEIINYVQSLQRQVEFLSMKLAAVNPRLDFNIESLLTKQQMLSSACPTPTLMLSPVDHANLLQLHATQQNAIQLGLSCGLDLTSSGNELNATLRRSTISPVAVDTYANSGFQTSSVWDELHNAVQLGFVSGHLSTGQMKVEL